MSADQSERLTYADLKEGDHVEVYLCGHFGWEWEQRIVTKVDQREDGLFVSFATLADEEYTVHTAKDRDRQFRRFPDSSSKPGAIPHDQPENRAPDSSQNLRGRLAAAMDPFEIVQGAGGRSAVQRSNEELADAALEAVAEYIAELTTPTFYVCPDCNHLGPMSSFQGECSPGWTHGALIKVLSADFGKASNA